MTPREWLNVLNILESIDEVPGMPDRFEMTTRTHGGWQTRHQMFLRDPVRFFRSADDATQEAIWKEVTRRLEGRAEQPALPGLPAPEGEASCQAS